MRNRKPSKKSPKKIYIYSEGESEEIYFNKLKEYYEHEFSITIRHKNKQGQDLIDYVKNKYERHDFDNQPIDIYIILDNDGKDPNDMQNIFQSCCNNNYNIIYSNYCFELWVLLHFNRNRRSLNYKQLKREIERIIKVKYNKTDKKFFEKLVKDIKIAINNSDFNKSLTYNVSNPYTNVGEVIKQLFKI